jgi:hypothetical protein
MEQRKITLADVWKLFDAEAIMEVLPAPFVAFLGNDFAK